MKKYFILFLISLIALNSNAQINWTAGQNISMSMYGNQHPRIATDRAGNPLVLWGNANKAMFSRWNGSGFTTPAMINPMSIPVASGSWMGPDISAHGDTIYVVFKQNPETDTSSHIYLLRSYDGGATFSMPMQVDQIGDSLSRFPTVTVDDNGNPIVGFMKFNTGFGDARWVVTKSSDMGTTFTSDVKVSGWSAPGAPVCDCCPAVVACEGSNVAMVYRDNNNNIRDTWAGISNDGGATFNTGVAVDQTYWNLFACPSTGADAFIYNDSLYSVFTSGASGVFRVYRSVTAMSNAFVQPTQYLTTTIAGLAQQNFPRIAREGNAAAIVWTQTVNGTDQLPILFTNNITNGFTNVYDTVDLGNVVNTDVALANGKVFVVWQDDNSGTVKYRQGTYATTSINEITVTRNTIQFYPNPATDKIIINTDSPLENVKIRVLDLLGKILIEKDISYGEKVIISINDLANGQYILKLNSDNLNLTNLFLKK